MTSRFAKSSLPLAALFLAGASLSFAADDAIGGILGGPKNPGQAAYVEQLKRMPANTKIPGIPEPILLWPNGAPEAKPDANGVFTDEDKPAIYAFPAPANNNTGASMLILPGGGFTNRVMDTEGVQIAKFLNRHGISGFVLRYRLVTNYPRTVPTMDAHRAMRHIRANAAKFNIAPDRIGVIGFSAGGELQGDAFYNGVVEGDPNAADPVDRVSTRANFSVLIYGGRNLQNPASAPPTFIFCTVEDGSSGRGPGPRGVLVSALNSLRGAGVPVEAHFYQVGPHGTTMSPGDPQLGQWPGLMINWMKSSGFLTAKK
jgi:acetyl esterase/lipase